MFLSVGCCEPNYAFVCVQSPSVLDGYELSYNTRYDPYYYFGGLGLNPEASVYRAVFADFPGASAPINGTYDLNFDRKTETQDPFTTLKEYQFVYSLTGSGFVIELTIGRQYSYIQRTGTLSTFWSGNYTPIQYGGGYYSATPVTVTKL